MASNWADAAKELADLIEHYTDYEADVQPANLNLPGFWVTPVSRDFDTLDGESYLATFEVFGITSPAPGVQDVLATLSDMQDALRTLGDTVPELHGIGQVAEIYQVSLDSKNPDGLPGIKTTITLEVD